MKIKDINHVRLVGYFESEFKFDHYENETRIYSTVFITKRLSQVTDRIPVSISESLLRSVDENELLNAKKVKLEGYIISGTRNNKLHICVRINQEMHILDDSVPYMNKVKLSGKVASEVKVRERKNGVTVCDFMFASNLKDNFKIYVPVIAWNRIARFISSFNMGREMIFDASFQSRNFTQITPDGNIEREVYEISIIRVRKVN